MLAQRSPRPSSRLGRRQRPLHGPVRRPSGSWPVCPPRSPRGDVAYHHGVGADPGTVADGDSSQNLGAGPDEHLVPDDRAPVPVVIPADGHLVNQELAPMRSADRTVPWPWEIKRPGPMSVPAELKPGHLPHLAGRPGPGGPPPGCPPEPVVEHGAEPREAYSNRPTAGPVSAIQSISAHRATSASMTVCWSVSR